MKNIDINKLMVDVNEWVKNILKGNYVGVYFHGSLRLGSFNPNKSDLDFIIVVKDKLNYESKKKICDVMMDNLSLFPKKGFEFSVVTEKYCKEFIYPTPYELHMSCDWYEKYRSDVNMVINEDEKVDSDLASHFNVINVPNSKLDFGKPSIDVFSIVPKEYVMDSNYSDTLECADNILDNPIYCILNLCRFYALVKENMTLSKYDGGKWALKNMNSTYNDIISMAMDDYMSDTDGQYNNEKLKEFAKEAISLIKAELKK